MALSTGMLTFDLADMLGVDFDARRTKVTLSTNVPGDTLVDTAANKVRLGGGKVTVNADGTGSAVVWLPGPDGNPTSWQTYVHVDYPDTGSRERRVRTFGPFTIAASADLADLIAEQEIPPTYLSTVTAALDALGAAAVAGAQTARVGAETARDEAEAAAAAAVDLSNISTPDALVKTLIANPASQTAAELSATVAPIAAAAADVTITERRQPINAATTMRRGGMPEIVTLMCGSDDEAPVAQNGTLSVDTVNWKVGGRGHKVTATTDTIATVYLDPISPVTNPGDPLVVPPAQAVGMWVFVPDATKVTELRIFLYMNDALTSTWSFLSNNGSPSSKAIVTGWNFFRIPADAHPSVTAGSWSTLYRVSIAADITEVGATFTVGHVYLECPAKARVLLIADRGYETAFSPTAVLYQQLVERGYPITIALDLTLVGGGTGDFKAIDWNRIHEIASENGNQMSYHGYDGAVTATMTAPQLRADTVKAHKMLALNGFKTLWRAAYVQGSAPQWAATTDLQVASADGSGDISRPNPWPPIDLHRIHRYALDNNSATTATVDAWFAYMAKTHMTDLIFVHGYSAYLYDVAPALWAYFLAKLDAAVAAGWLECVTFEQLFYEMGGSCSTAGGGAVATYLDSDGSPVAKYLI